MEAVNEKDFLGVATWTPKTTSLVRFSDGAVLTYPSENRGWGTAMYRKHNDERVDKELLLLTNLGDEGCNEFVFEKDLSWRVCGYPDTKWDYDKKALEFFNA